MKRSLFLMGALFISGKAEAHIRHQHHYDRTSHLSGVASYYGPGFFGRETASGSIMHRRDMTAAHRTLPLGTRIRVMNEDNGRTVIVTVNDRGPYVGHRVLDLAERPASLLGMKETGTAHVKITPLVSPDVEMEVADAPEPRKYKPVRHRHSH